MKNKQRARTAALAALFGIGTGAVGTRLLAKPRQAEPASNVVNITAAATTPPGAIVLFSGKAEEWKKNFYQRYTKNDAAWTVDANGVATPDHHDITSKQEFGDLYFHGEFHEPTDKTGRYEGGNSGVCFQGRYEVQIFDSHGNPHPASTDAGAFYSQKAPHANGMKKASEWQTYDIFFRAPRFDATGKVTDQPRATVILNGVVVQNNESFIGPTGIQYSEMKGQPATGPLIMQGDHDLVQWRSAWVVPLN